MALGQQTPVPATGEQATPEPHANCWGTRPSSTSDTRHSRDSGLCALTC